MPKLGDQWKYYPAIATNKEPDTNILIMTGALKEFHRSVVILCDSMAAFTLTVRGKENYDLLCAMRDQLELASDLLREKNQASL